MKKAILLIACFLAALFNANAQNTLQLENTILTERNVVTGLTIPWEIKWGPDDHIWVTERPGNIKRVDPVTGNTQLILDHRSEVANEDNSGGSEYGMLGMEFHPDWENTPKIFVAYTYEQGFSIKERLSTFDWDGMELTNETIIINNIDGGGIHDGSRLLVTTDGKILMTTGDVGSSNLSQNMNSLNGKVLRLNLDGSIPDDNPIQGSYIYSYGHRNSQGITYGPNGIIYSSEHGAQSSDELNIIEPNRNYGWPNVQGACNTNSEINFCEQFNVREPLDEWSPCVAVNDVHYYEHPAIPEWNGKLMMAVLGGFAQLPRLSVFEMSADGTEVVEEVQYFKNFGRIRDICSNPTTGAIYFATNGPFYPGSGPNRIVEYYNADFVVSTLDEELDPLVTVFPNPATTTINVDFAESFIGYTMEMISFSGSKVVQDRIVKERRETFDISELPAGQYYISISNENGLVTKVFVKD